MNTIFKKKKIKDKANEWLKYTENRVKVSTYSYYCTVVYKHIINIIGEVPLNMINEEFIEKYISKLLTNKRIKESTVRQIIVILKQILKYSKINVQIKVPKIKRRKIDIFSENDKKNLENYLYKNINEESIGILLSMHLGLRIGEVCAIQWKNIDLNNGLIFIENTIERVKNFDNNIKTKTKLVLIKAKTENSIRTLPLDKKIIKILTRFVKNQKPNNFLLTSSLKPLDPRTYYNHYKNILKKYGLDKNYHSLRHTFATECIDLGLNPKALSEILGHSDIETTLSLYVHPSMKKTRDFLNKKIS